MKLFVVDPHATYRRELVTSLASLPTVDSVGEASSIRAARQDERLLEADLVLLDPAGEPCGDFIAGLPARVMVCSSSSDEDSVLAAVQAGAVGFLSKDTLTPEALGAAVVAAANSAERPETPLTEREQQVLTLIAAGHPTREVAAQLCYSERTVKNVVHDVITKLNARSRSQAVAFAVRSGLI